MRIGICLRNLLVLAPCTVAAAAIIVPAAYILIAGIAAEHAGKAMPLSTPPFTTGAAALAVLLAGITAVACGGLVIRIQSLWTIAAIVLAFPLLQLLTLQIPQHLPAKFLTAWQMMGWMPEWGWWTAVGAGAVLFLCCGPFGEPQPEQPEPPKPQSAAKKK